MRLPLTCRITKWVDLPLDEVNTIFQNLTSDSHNLLPKTVMYGTVVNGRIDALINPPNLLVDPFKSRVRGELKKENSLTKIDLRISLSWVLIVFGILWYIPMIIGFWGLITKDLGHVTERIIMLSIFSILPFGLSALKLNFDKRRLEDRIEEEIELVRTAKES